MTFDLLTCCVLSGWACGWEHSEENDPDLWEEILQNQELRIKFPDNPEKWVMKNLTPVELFLNLTVLMGNEMQQWDVTSLLLSAGSWRRSLTWWHHPGDARHRHDSRAVSSAGGAERRSLFAQLLSHDNTDILNITWPPQTSRDHVLD